ncbi:hypothetical protein V6N13_130061 [Hibiscus sabdariffa]
MAWSGIRVVEGGDNVGAVSRRRGGFCKALEYFWVQAVFHVIAIFRLPYEFLGSGFRADKVKWWKAIAGSETVMGSIKAEKGIRLWQSQREEIDGSSALSMIGFYPHQYRMEKGLTDGGYRKSFSHDQ